MLTHWMGSVLLYPSAATAHKSIHQNEQGENPKHSPGFECPLITYVRGLMPRGRGIPATSTTSANTEALPLINAFRLRDPDSLTLLINQFIGAARALKLLSRAANPDLLTPRVPDPRRQNPHSRLTSNVNPRELRDFSANIAPELRAPWAPDRGRPRRAHSGSAHCDWPW
jgi:hypothetical protein